MRKALTPLGILTLGAALATGPLLAPSPAHASDAAGASCVTKAEWQQVKQGMKKARVHRIFGTRGTFASGFAGGYTRRYRPCAWTTTKLYVSYAGTTQRVVTKTHS